MQKSIAELTPAEKLILRTAREEMEALEMGYSWRERSAALTRAANRLGITTDRVAAVYDRSRND